MAEVLLARLPMEAVKIITAMATSATPSPIAPSRWPTKVGYLPCGYLADFKISASEETVLQENELGLIRSERHLP